MLWELVMPLIYMTENVPVKQNDSVRMIFTPVLQKERNICLKQDKVSMRVLSNADSQVFFNPFQPGLVII